MYNTLLTFPEMGKPYEVYTDVSKEGLGGVLMQERRVIANKSQKLKPHEENYPIHDFELAAIIFGLKKWRHYLYRVTFEIFIDHMSFKYICTQEDLNMCRWKWMEFLEEFQCPINYHLGKENMVANVLCQKVRIPALQMVQAPDLENFSMAGQIKLANIQVQQEWLQRLREAQGNAEELKRLKEKT
jgi:hypothetical protein